MDKKDIVLALYDIGAIRLGEFTLASGLTSNLYIDLRQIISHPRLLEAISQCLWAQLAGTHADLICGVPYTALPIATCLSLHHDIPMVMARKEPKKYGTKKQIEGAFKQGQTCYMIEDLVTTGGSVIKAADLLASEGLHIEHVAVLIDRQQGGKENLREKGYHLHAAMTITDIITTLRVANKLSAAENQLATQHLQTLA